MRRILIVLCAGCVLVACSTSTPVAAPTTTTPLLTPTVLAKVDQTIRAETGDELFSYQRVEASATNLVVHTGLFWKRENADPAQGLCVLAARGLIEAGAEKAHLTVVAANGDNLALTLGSAGSGGTLNGNCQKTSAFR